MVYSTRRFVLPCVILLLYFSVLLALRLPRLGKRELVLVIVVRLFDSRLFGFVCFLFLFLSGTSDLIILYIGSKLGWTALVIVALPGLFSYLFC